MSIYNANKATLAHLYKTMRVELGSDIKITLVTPGFIESELTQGKFLSHEGRTTVNPDAHASEHVSNGESKKLCKGNSETSHQRITVVTKTVVDEDELRVKVLWPEVVEWFNH